MAATLSGRTTWTADHAPTVAEALELLNGLYRISNIGILTTDGTATLSSSSASYTSVTNASISWTKDGGSSDSDIGVLLLLSAFVSGTGVNWTWGIRIGSTDYDVAPSRWNAANSHQFVAGVAKITGVGAGGYTPIVRAKQTSGAATMTIDSSDTVSFLIAELPK